MCGTGRWARPGTPAGLPCWSAGQTRICPGPLGLSMRNYRRKNSWIRLTGSLLDHVREVAVPRRIVGQLGVKCHHENAALAGHHAFTAVHDERGDGRPQSAYAGSPDEDHLERLRSEEHRSELTS